MERNMEVVEMTKKVMRKLKKEVGERAQKLSVTENGKEGKSKIIASRGSLEEKLRECSQEEGQILADSVETLGVDLRTKIERLGAKEIARRKKCRVRLSLIKKNKAFQKEELDEGRIKKLLRMGLVPARAWKSLQWDCSRRKILKLRRQMAAAAGKKGVDFAFLVLGSVWS